MNSFMSWVGGKKALREQIVGMLPVNYAKYVEVFGGGGWVLFHKPPGGDFEVYNDLNGLLVNLYRCVRDRHEELIAELKYVLNSRVDFERAKATLMKRGKKDQVKKAALFYQLIRYSYGAALKSYAAQPHDIWSDFPLIEQAHRRLGSVVIEHQDFGRLIPHYDSEDTVFYCDPPYHTTEKYYMNIGETGFTERDHIRLRDTLLGIRGKFILSYNDDEFVRKLYAAPGIRVTEVTRLNQMKQRYEANSQFEELIRAAWALHNLSAELLTALARECGGCDGLCGSCDGDCPFDSTDFAVDVDLPKEILKLGGVSDDAVLHAEYPGEDGILLRENDGEPGLWDVPLPLMEGFMAAGVCPASLELLLRSREVVYGK